MKFDFVKWNNGEWVVQHPDTSKLGFGKTKLAAVRDLESQIGARLTTR